MTRILRYIHVYWLFFWIVFFNLLFLPFFYVFSRSPKTYGILNVFRTLSCTLCSFFGGLIFRFEYEQKINRKGTFIYCANHASSIDILVMCVLARGKYHFIGKEELLKSPFWRIFFKTIDIPVNRESRISSFKAFKRVGENLDNKMSLIIFPEGKIGNDYPPELLEFKNGPFRLAIEKKVPILPVSIINLWEHFWDSGLERGTTPGIIKIFVHKPIETVGMDVSMANDLKDKVYEIMKQKISYP